MSVSKTPDQLHDEGMDAMGFEKVEPKTSTAESYPDIQSAIECVEEIERRMADWNDGSRSLMIAKISQAIREAVEEREQDCYQAYGRVLNQEKAKIVPDTRKATIREMLNRFYVTHKPGCAYTMSRWDADRSICDCGFEDMRKEAGS